MELIDFIAATLAVIAGSVVQVASGVGGGFIIVPLLAWVDIGLVPAPLLFASLSLSGLMAAREWHAVDCCAQLWGCSFGSFGQLWGRTNVTY